jgi:hypothetical protein
MAGSSSSTLELNALPKFAKIVALSIYACTMNDRLARATPEKVGASLGVTIGLMRCDRQGS